MTIRTVFFDADGVLQGPGDHWLADLVAVVGIDDEQRLRALGSEIRAAQKRTLDGSEKFTATVAPVLAAWSIECPPEAVVAVWDRIVVDPQMMAEVQRLQEDGVRCGLITNQHAERAALMRTEYGFDQVFDPGFYSCDLGRTKPDPLVFELAISALDHPVGEALLIDDHEHNVVAARMAGMVAERFAKHGGRAELRRILAAHHLIR